MKAIPTAIPEVILLEPKVFGDDRGYFMETYNTRVFEELTACSAPFVQDNQSRSNKGVLRGLHYQIGQRPQDKLIRALSGEILDVAVDIRRSSPTFGKWVSAVLSGENKRQLWVPKGFAHGFVVLSDSAEVAYKVTDYYDRSGERAILWNDPDINIDWPQNLTPQVSDRDEEAPLLRDADLFE